MVGAFVLHFALAFGQDRRGLLSLVYQFLLGLLIDRVHR